jgi:hypothetical protein
MTPQSTNREAVAISRFDPLAIRGEPRSLGDRDLPGARPKQVLEILLAARGDRVPTDRRADLLWGECLPQHAAAALQAFLSVLCRRPSADRRRRARPPKALYSPCARLAVPIRRWTQLSPHVAEHTVAEAVRGYPSHERAH